MTAPRIVRTLPALRNALSDLRKRNARVGLIATMGALHDGHLSLVRLAKKHADRIVVSIFVNPTQFAAHEDFGSYPRTLKTDVAKLSGEGVDLVWSPDAKTMYPDGFATRIGPEGPALAGLEDRFRPHFFGGVATVVGKLFNQVRPHVTVFGEKDYQQLQVVPRLSRDLDMGVRAIGAPVIRERDGLAMSSRNAYLSADERGRAPVLHRVLKASAKAIRDGASPNGVLTKGVKAIEAEGFVMDYLEARHAQTLAPVSSLKDGPIRLLVAARIGTTRLIDNVRV